MIPRYAAAKVKCDQFHVHALSTKERLSKVRQASMHFDKTFARISSSAASRCMKKSVRGAER
jgi:hypothetical protein